MSKISIPVRNGFRRLNPFRTRASTSKLVRDPKNVERGEQLLDALEHAHKALLNVLKLNIPVSAYNALDKKIRVNEMTFKRARKNLLMTKEDRDVISECILSLTVVTENTIVGVIASNYDSVLSDVWLSLQLRMHAAKDLVRDSVLRNEIMTIRMLLCKIRLRAYQTDQFNTDGSFGLDQPFFKVSFGTLVLFYQGDVREYEAAGFLTAARRDLERLEGIFSDRAITNYDDAIVELVAWAQNLTDYV